MNNEKLNRMGLVLLMIGGLIWMIGLIMSSNVPSIVIWDSPEYGVFTIKDPYETERAQRVIYTGWALVLVGLFTRAYVEMKKK